MENHKFSHANAKKTAFIYVIRARRSEEGYMHQEIASVDEMKRENNSELYYDNDPNEG